MSKNNEKLIKEAASLVTNLQAAFGVSDAEQDKSLKYVIYARKVQIQRKSKNARLPTK